MQASFKQRVPWHAYSRECRRCASRQLFSESSEGPKLGKLLPACVPERGTCMLPCGPRKHAHRTATTSIRERSTKDKASSAGYAPCMVRVGAVRARSREVDRLKHFCGPQRGDTHASRRARIGRRWARLRDRRELVACRHLIRANLGLGRDLPPRIARVWRWSFGRGALGCICCCGHVRILFVRRRHQLAGRLHDGFQDLLTSPGCFRPPFQLLQEGGPCRPSHSLCQLSKGK